PQGRKIKIGEPRKPPRCDFLVKLARVNSKIRALVCRLVSAHKQPSGSGSRKRITQLTCTKPPKRSPTKARIVRSKRYTFQLSNLRRSKKSQSCLGRKIPRNLAKFLCTIKRFR